MRSTVVGVRCLHLEWVSQETVQTTLARRMESRNKVMAGWWGYEETRGYEEIRPWLYPWSSALSMRGNPVMRKERMRTRDSEWMWMLKRWRGETWISKVKLK